MKVDWLVNITYRFILLFSNDDDRKWTKLENTRALTLSLPPIRYTTFKHYPKHRVYLSIDILAKFWKWPSLRNLKIDCLNLEMENSLKQSAITNARFEEAFPARYRLYYSTIWLFPQYTRKASTFNYKEILGRNTKNSLSYVIPPRKNMSFLYNHNIKTIILFLPKLVPFRLWCILVIVFLFFNNWLYEKYKKNNKKLFIKMPYIFSPFEATLRNS